MSFLNMKIHLTDTQCQDIEVALLTAMAHTEKNSKIKVEKNPLIQRYLKTYDQIAEVRKNQKIKDSWIKALQ